MSLTFSFRKKITSPSRKTLATWLSKVASAEKRNLGTLAYTFVDDEELWRMNKQFLNHDTYTDIISFDYSEEDTVSGEIYISVDRLVENAGKHNVTLREELLRVMAHGLLHLCGYKDKSPIQQKQMRAAEERALRLFKS